MGHDQEEFEQKKKKQIADAKADKELSELRAKAEKWDKLDERIGKFYEDDAEGDLADIGEIAAMAFGYL